jgi:hypothetical protein
VCLCFTWTTLIDRNYTNRNIYILSNSQPAIKALDNSQINSKLVWDCHESLAQVAKHNGVQPIWVPAHEGIVGTETADRLAKLGSKCPFKGPEPAHSISVEVAKKAVRNWTTRDHRKHWGSLTGLRQAQGIIQGSLCQKNQGTVEIK